jgi:hypothetical protein
MTKAEKAAGSEEINLYLLHCIAFLAMDEPTRALHSANAAGRAAKVAGTAGLGLAMYHLECKIHFYRGICLMRLRKWKEASWELTRAANIRPWAKQITGLKRECEQMMEDGNCAENESAEANEVD